MGGVAAAPVFREIITQIISHPELEFAEKILQSSPIPLQLPLPREVQVASKKMKATDRNPAGDNSGGLPDCIGKDLRDAVNIVISRGFRPFAVGCGMVNRQAPPAGTKIAPAAACTLYCSLEG